MITYNKETPVLLVASGSVETTRQIYNELQRIEPQRLYLVFDASASGEHGTVGEQTQSVFKEIQWKCKVKTLRIKTRSGYNAILLKVFPPGNGRNSTGRLRCPVPRFLCLLFLPAGKIPDILRKISAARIRRMQAYGQWFMDNYVRLDKMCERIFTHANNQIG